MSDLSIIFVAGACFGGAFVTLLRYRAASRDLGRNEAVDELRQIEATMTEDQVRASAMLLIGWGFPMSPPPPVWAWKKAYTAVLCGQTGGMKQ